MSSDVLATYPALAGLLGCGLITLLVILERGIAFWQRRGSLEPTLSAALDCLEKGQIHEAAWICSCAAPPWGSVAAESLTHPADSPLEVEQRMRVALNDQRLGLGRNLGTLSAMVGLAPIMGGLGTVLAARSALAPPAIDGAALASSLTMLALGLAVSALATVTHRWFSRRLEVMLTEAETATRTILASYSERLRMDRRLVSREGTAEELTDQIVQALDVVT